MARSHTTLRLGFTTPELLVAMLVMTLLSAAVVSTTVAWLTSYTVSGQRTQTTTDLRFSLSKISTDISQSYGALTALPAAAVTETTPPAPVGGWVGNTSVLILGKTPRSSVDGSGIYADPDYYEGDPDSIIYYVSNNVLYRRTVPVGGASYPNNALGVAPAQTKVISDVTSFEVEYYKDGNTLSTVTDATSISVKVTATRMQAGKTVSYTDKIQIALQKFADLAPPTLGVPPNPQYTHGLIMGYGGMSVVSSKVRASTTLHIKGKLSLKNPGTRVSTTGNVHVEGEGCTSPSAYSVCPDSTITASFGTRVSAAQVCAKNQANDIGGRLTVFAPSCSPPTTVTLPPFNKNGFINGPPAMSSGPPSVDCTNEIETISAGTIINGDVNVNRGCTLKLQGNVYIKGSLNVYWGTIVPDTNVTTHPPIIVVNGAMSFKYNSNVKSNTPYGIAPIFISYYSSDTSGSPATQANCASDSPTIIPLSETRIYNSVKSDSNDFKGTTQAIGVYNSDVKGSLYAVCDSIKLASGATFIGSLAGQALSIEGHSSVRLLPGVWPQ